MLYLGDVIHGQKAKEIVDKDFNHLEDGVHRPVLEPAVHVILLFSRHGLHSAK